MKKLVVLASITVMQFKPDMRIRLVFIDYTPETEQVNPVKERLDKFAKSLEAKGVPKDVIELMTGFGDISPPPPMSGYAINQHTIEVTQKEYEELGNPTIGKILELEVNLFRGGEEK